MRSDNQIIDDIYKLCYNIRIIVGQMAGDTPIAIRTPVVGQQ